MPTTWLPLYQPPPPLFVTKSSNSHGSFVPLSPQPRFSRKTCTQSRRLPAAASSSSSSSSSLITDFDLYALLGIDSSCDQSQIKLAYRALQKRCHPDIAGPPGHDMAIVLNEAYSILSDPNSRRAYDKEQAKMGELRGYTGKPLYSVWMGPESEDRAVFVDEVKCVGCLKCALFANKTFAIESVYGRARVVAQWADPEHKIQAAIDTCPVDCISFVERAELAALEFLMSKQPRGNVRIGASNSAGVRVSNIFVDVKKFQTKVSSSNANAMNREADLQKMSAVQAIRSLWLYWLAPTNPASRNQQHKLKLLPLAKTKSIEPDIEKLHQAATARRHARESTKPVGPPRATNPDQGDGDDAEYWVPSTQTLPSSTMTSDSRERDNSKSSVRRVKEGTSVRHRVVEKERKRSLTIPAVAATVAAVIVYLQVGERAVVGGLNEHIAGSAALDVVNSSWLQVSLAWMTWFFIGAAAVELGEAIRNNKS